MTILIHVGKYPDVQYFILTIMEFNMFEKI